MPKLRPLQIVGIAAVLIFGARLALTLTEPKRDPFSLPSAIPTPTVLIENGARDDPIALEALMELGSEGVRDDFYCAGLMTALNSAAPDKTSATVSERDDFKLALTDKGLTGLFGEDITEPDTVQEIIKAHAAEALEDLEAGATRIPEAVCTARGKAAVTALMES